MSKVDTTAQSKSPRPILTILVLIVTTIGALLQFLNPQVLTALRRDPAALAAGEWWRLLSPLLVLDGSFWIHFATDAAGFLLVGIIVEQRLGRLRWLALFILAALAGEIAGYAWDPTGAGASIALFGLIAGLVVWQSRTRELHLIASLYSIGLVAALASEAVAAKLGGSDIVEIVIPVIACSVVINGLLVLRGRSPDGRIPISYALAITLVGALILIVLQDIHGVALLVGLVVAAALLWRGTTLRTTSP